MQSGPDRILGGLGNEADGFFAAVAGGQLNDADGDRSSILGGSGTTVNTRNGCHPAC